VWCEYEICTVLAGTVLAGTVLAGTVLAGTVLESVVGILCICILYNEMNAVLGYTNKNLKSNIFGIFRYTMDVYAA